MLVRFWANHHLLDLIQRPCWRVVKGRSKTYVDKVLSELPDVRTSTPVASVTRSSNGNGDGGVTVTTAAGDQSSFDAVVLATHSDVSLKLLGADATVAERQVLGAIPYNQNEVYLHTGRTGVLHLHTCVQDVTKSCSSVKVCLVVRVAKTSY